jgi:NAD(P)-dependent dehydrogenase (short-subunit alcohol dehydrogenase family)
MRSMNELAGKRALVTGGSGGIGFMIAHGMAAAGAEVYICSRKADACERAAKEIAAVGVCTPLPADLSREESWSELATALGPAPLHVLVNNAGATWGAPLGEYPKSAFDKVLTLNVTAVFGLTQALLPQLRAAAGDADPARVINIGSIDGTRIPTWENYAYPASKAAVHQLTRQLAARLAQDRITVNGILPGPFLTRMMAPMIPDDASRSELLERMPLGRLGEPEDIAALVNFLAGPGGRWMTGALIPLDGGAGLTSA